MTNSVSNFNSPRIEVVDALRGFAIMSILFLHHIEHFDYYFFPEYLPDWLKAIDKIVWDTLFFLFGGKSYAIFALLFGFSFYIQNHNQEKRGNDFRLRFIWRLFLLFGFGCINSIFYEGDILMFYAFLGLVLIPVCKWSDKAVFITAVFLMVQPLEWLKLIDILLNPEFIPESNLSNFYFGKMEAIFNSHSFIETAIGNLKLGKMAVIYWSWENGRFFQAPALFMLGMLLGRKQLFVTTPKMLHFWTKALLYSILVFLLLYTFKTCLPNIVSRKVVLESLSVILTTWSNAAFMMVLVSSFVKLYQHIQWHVILSKLIPFGKMSLSNYVIQSIVGTFVYYRYGFGLVEYTGATFSFLTAIVLFVIQLLFCKWWLKKHKYGPLEYLWHKGTWISISKKQKIYSIVRINK